MGIYEQGFDEVAWCKKHILPNSFISMDDVSVKSRLQWLARCEIQTAGVCAALLRELKMTLLGATQRTLTNLQAEVAYLRESKKELEGEKESLISNLSKARERVKQSEAALAVSP